MAALAALLVGEYDLSVPTGVVAGVLTGLAVVEAVRVVEPAVMVRRWWLLAALGAASTLWGGWISVRHRHESLPGWAWAGAAAAAAVVALRTRAGDAGSGGSDSRSGP